MRKVLDAVSSMVYHPGLGRLVTHEQADAITRMSKSPEHVDREVERAFEERENKLAENAL